MTKSFAALGECMIEMRHQADFKLTMGFSGDTLNATIYFKRLCKHLNIAVDYITALGNDPYSDMMIQSWQQEGIGTDLVQRMIGALPGLYLIRTDHSGERSFYYYRQQAAAKKMLRGMQGDNLCTALSNFDYIYFSGITLAIIDERSREKLFSALKKARSAGAIIAFDTNYRQQLWPDKNECQKTIHHFMKVVDIALPTFEDAQLLFDDKSPENTVARLHQAGPTEVVVKQGDQGCLVSTGNEQSFVATEAKINAVDTTSAGDSFNAAYLAARMQAAKPTHAALTGHRLAAVVVQHPGAIIPAAAMPTDIL